MHTHIFRHLPISVTALALIILLLPSNPRSTSPRVSFTNPFLTLADGPEMPPFPPKITTRQLIADGPEMPPFPPRTTQKLVASGIDRSALSPQSICA